MTTVRHAFRRLAQTPGFTFVAILTLALGIGASTAIFSVVNSVLLQPLAFREPGQLVWLRESTPSFGQAVLPINAHHFLTWRERATSFSALSVFDAGSITLTGLDRPEQLALAGVSSGFFELLGVAPALGRSFAPEEEIDGRHRVVVISDALWRRTFAADPGLLGRSIQLDHEPHVVIGILPASYQPPHPPADVFRPKTFAPEELREKFGRHNYGAIGRLRPGVTLDQATAELNQIGSQILAAAGLDHLILRAVVTPLQESLVGQSRRGLWLLFAAVVSVLLIACVNLTNFLLAQAERRKQESAVRQALGASRAQLIRQALAESLLVSCLGGALGVVAAQLGLMALLHGASTDIPRLAEVRLDGAVLLFALGVSLFTGLLFGLVPAWRLAQSNPQEALSAGNRTIAGAGGRRLSDALIAAEVALSLLLLATAALLGGSFARLLRADQGFHASSVLSAKVTIPVSVYAKPEQRLAFFEQLLAHLSSAPGIRDAAMVSALPLQGETWIDKAAVAGDPRPLAEKADANVRFIDPSYFQTLGIPLRAGRAFTLADRSRKVAIISDTLAQRLWPGEDPIGRRMERHAGDEYEVIGVAGNVRVAADRAPVPTMYRPYWDWPPRRMNILIRTAGDPRHAAGSLRDALHAVDPDVPIPAMHTMTDVLDQSVAPQRFQLMIAGVFAATALLLTALGIYGVVAYSVSRRRKELGIRMAFGAPPGAVKRLVVRQGLAPVLLGLALGVAGALAAGRLLNSFLYETDASDPLALGMVSATLVIIAAIACYLPSRQATRIDPIESLRAE